MSGFTDFDLVNYRYLVYCNLIQSAYQLLEGAELLQIEADNDVLVGHLIKLIYYFYSQVLLP